MMRTRIAAVCAGALLLSTATVNANPVDVIDWDDIPTTGNFLTFVPADYLGQTWSGDLNGGGRGGADLLSAINGGWGASLPEISSPNIFYNGYGDDDVWVKLDSVHSLNSAYVTGWPNTPGFAASVRVVGMLSSVVVYDETFFTINNEWSLVDFGGVKIDELHIYRPVGEPMWWLMDDLDLTAGGLSAVLDCPIGGGTATLSVSGGTPGGPLGVAASTNGAGFTIPIGPCTGTAINTRPPFLPGFPIKANFDANGDFSARGNVPAGLCGVISVSTVDLTTCDVAESP